MGCPYIAVGMQRALDSAIGLPSRSTSASWMLGFLMPADVSSNFMMALLSDQFSTIRLAIRRGDGCITDYELSTRWPNVILARDGRTPSSEPRSALASGSNWPGGSAPIGEGATRNSWPRWREREPSACWPCRSGRSPTPSGR